MRLRRLWQTLSSGDEAPGEFRQNLADLQSAAVTSMALFTGGLGYAWVAALLWTAPQVRGGPLSWAAALALILSASVAFLIRPQHLYLAGHLVVWGAMAAVALALQAYPTHQAAYLFVAPIIFSSAIHRRWTLFLTAAISAAITWGTHLRRPAEPTLDALLPICIIAITAVASWMAARNLYTALHWVWSGYERARHNEDLARSRQAELERALKALDEAVYRTERANQRLALARSQADTARRLKQQFAQTVSHELRMPLNLILSFVELMINSPEYYGGPLPASYLRELSIVHRNARHLQTLVNDVLDMARIQAAQMSLQPEEVDPEAMLHEVAAMARSLIEARGLALRLAVAPGLPRLWIDPIRIRQVLLNLLNNAARFTDAGSVTLRAGQDGEYVSFAVVDTGVGIAPQDLQRVFNEFETLEGAGHRQTGAGLGLAISRAFVELHGGRIWAESEVGRGSAFCFCLPVAPQPQLAGALPAGSAAGAGPGRGDGQPILLAVTTSPTAAVLLARYVRGCRTVVVPDLDQARQAAAQLAPDAIVIDAAGAPMLPADLDTLARAWGLPDVPVLLTPLPGEARLRHELQVDAYLVKPITREQLWDLLRQFGHEVERVLVVDTDHDFLRLISRLLEGSPVRPYHVIPAYSGQEALALLDWHRPDLVLLDLALGDMPGEALIQAIRARSEWQSVRVVVISGQDDVDPRGGLAGPLVVVKANGLTAAEIVHWTRQALSRESGVLDWTEEPAEK